MSFSNINYNLYKSFIAVYETKNMSRAAKELYIGQPNVSRNIKELEKCLDVKLFHSNPRGVEPTSEARELYYKVFSAISLINYGERNIKTLDRESAGIIRIACTTNTGWHLLAKYIYEFNFIYPRIQFDVINKTSEEAIEMLERNHIDLVLSLFPLNDKGEFERIEIKQMKEVGFASHEFATKHGLECIVTTEKFKELPYIINRYQEPLKKPIAIVDSQEMIFQFAMKGFGVGFCLEHFLDNNHPNDSVFKFKFKDKELPERVLTCLYNKDDLGKAVGVFLNMIKKF